MKPEDRAVRETALAFDLGFVDDPPARRARPPMSARVPSLRTRITRQHARTKLRTDLVPYLHDGPRGFVQRAPSGRRWLLDQGPIGAPGANR